MLSLTYRLRLLEARARISLAKAEIEDETIRSTTSLRRRESEFDLDALTEEQCLSMFRFTAQEIHRIRVGMNLPAKLEIGTDPAHKFKVTAEEALAICMRRLAFPARLCDLETAVLSRSIASISRIFNDVSTLLEFDVEQFTPEKCRIFSEAIRAKGAPVTNCIGFIDGTVRPIVRPIRHQKETYNGHKRTHALKYQSVFTPDGITASIAGPFTGSHHDGYLLRQSVLLTRLERHLNISQNETYVLYGDPAYRRHRKLRASFKGPLARVCPDQRAFNKAMSKVRIAVEWEFGKTVNLWKFLSFKRSNIILLSPVGKYYLVATLLKNIHTCLGGSQTASYFNLSPPTLEEHLARANRRRRHN